MKMPIRPQAGMKIPKNWFRDLYDYVAAMTVIRGDRKNITVTQTAAGQVIRFIGKNGIASAGTVSGGGGEAFKYQGPFSLYIGETQQIHMRPGILWTPDGAEWVQPNYIPKPSAASFIVFDNDSGDRIVPMTDDGSLGSFTRQNPHYWDTHAIIGRYDPATDTLEQYHFSPVVFFIETEDFVIEPE